VTNKEQVIKLVEFQKSLNNSAKHFRQALHLSAELSTLDEHLPDIRMTGMSLAVLGFTLVVHIENTLKSLVSDADPIERSEIVAYLKEAHERDPEVFQGPIEFDLFSSN
tara:strand:- start:126 stop:452 length:327 start_codon:yes stop_codon:yes gene_type:complete